MWYSWAMIAIIFRIYTQIVRDGWDRFIQQRWLISVESVLVFTSFVSVDSSVVIRIVVFIFVLKGWRFKFGTFSYWAIS